MLLHQAHVLLDMIWLLALAQAGLRLGQKLRKISDPVKKSEMWTISDNASLRFVRDAVRYRRPETIDLVIQDDGKPSSELDYYVTYFMCNAEVFIVVTCIIL